MPGLNRSWKLALCFISLFFIELFFFGFITGGHAQELSELIEGAKKEGKVVYYTGMTLPHATLMADEFQKKYPFVKVEINRGSGEDVVIKALAEARAKSVKADIFQCSIVDISHLKENGLLMKYVSPESKAYPEKMRDPQGYWNALYILPYVMTYNTKLISAQDAPKTYADLLNPKWKGKIGIEQEEYQWFYHLVKIMGREKGMEYMKSLAKQDLMFRKGHTLLVTLCAAGEVPIVVVAYLDAVQYAQQTSGAPIEWVRFRSSPTITAIDVSSIAASAPHPNAAKLFHNFMLSEEGGKVLKKVNRIGGRPTDQPPELKELNLYVAYPDEFLAGYKALVRDWEETFHPPK